MKKTRLGGIILVSALTLTGCTTKQDKLPEVNQTPPVSTVAEQSGQQNTQNATGTILPSNQTSMCATSIKDYLAKADLKGTGTKKIEKGHKVVVHYIGRLDDETVFDTSIEEIAKACDKYSSGRNYSEGLAFQVGAGQMIPGFDKGVEGMKIGQTKTIHIKAKDAYGERSEKNVIKVPHEQIPNADQLKKGMKVYASNGQPFTVYAIDSKEISLDANPELAGKDLIFDITVTAIE